ncbi:MAG: NifB/NifX family molybdenum-iron cluster-binding protein [Akkermansiaceae bacterium]|nr:NifB/NifX family molybdenum-iron cluster-binding protein [Akkermansiaceae bacterium]
MIYHDSYICLGVDRDAGLDSVLGKHFGRSAYDFLYDTVTDDWEVVGRPLMERGCYKASRAMVWPRIASVFTRGIGHHAYHTLLKRGISVWLTPTRTVGETLDAWRSGLLVPLLETQLGGHLQHCQQWHQDRELEKAYELMRKPLLSESQCIV